MQSSSLMPVKSPSRRTPIIAHFTYRSVTPALAFPLPTRPSCFRSFSKPIMRSRARRAAPAWGWPYRSASSRCTAAKSGSRPRLDFYVLAPSHCRAAGGGRMRKRILVVEDQPDNCQIIRDMLAPTDYEITEAEDGQQALEAIAKQRPDLILMDIQLPIIDGYTATRKIKADPAIGRAEHDRDELAVVARRSGDKTAQASRLFTRVRRRRLCLP